MQNQDPLNKKYRSRFLVKQDNFSKANNTIQLWDLELNQCWSGEMFTDKLTISISFGIFTVDFNV